MIRRPDPDLIIRLATARKIFDLKLAELAEELHVTPEWLSKLMNRHQPPSYNIGLRFEAFLRARGAEPETFGRKNVGLAPKSQEGEPFALRTTIAVNHKKLLHAAGADCKRLRWLAQQFRRLVVAQRRWTQGQVGQSKKSLGDGAGLTRKRGRGSNRRSGAASAPPLSDGRRMSRKPD
jgi:transcriptional regulator with XRE-family HTH domain